MAHVVKTDNSVQDFSTFYLWTTGTFYKAMLENSSPGTGFWYLGEVSWSWWIFYDYNGTHYLITSATEYKFSNNTKIVVPNNPFWINATGYMPGIIQSDVIVPVYADVNESMDIYGTMYLVSEKTADRIVAEQLPVPLPNNMSTGDTYIFDQFGAQAGWFEYAENNNITQGAGPKNLITAYPSLNFKWAWIGYVRAGFLPIWGGGGALPGVPVVLLAGIAFVMAALMASRLRASRKAIDA